MNQDFYTRIRRIQAIIYRLELLMLGTAAGMAITGTVLFF